MLHSAVITPGDVCVVEEGYRMRENSSSWEYHPAGVLQVLQPTSSNGSRVSVLPGAVDLFKGGVSLKELEDALITSSLQNFHHLVVQVPPLGVGIIPAIVGHMHPKKVTWVVCTCRPSKDVEKNIIERSESHPPHIIRGRACNPAPQLGIIVANLRKTGRVDQHPEVVPKSQFQHTEFPRHHHFKG